MQESGLSDGRSADRGTKWATHASKNTQEIQDTGYKYKCECKYRIQETNAKIELQALGRPLTGIRAPTITKEHNEYINSQE